MKIVKKPKFDTAGVHQVNATYVGLDNIQVNNGTITIPKSPAEITVENAVIELFVYDSADNGAKLNPNDAGNLTFTLSNTNVAKVEDEKIIAIGEGTAAITVSFAGNDDYLAAKNKTITVNVKKQKISIVVDDVSTTYNINKDLIITLKDSNGTALSGVNITVDLNGAKTYTTDNNGQVKVSTNGLAPKAYTAKVTFNGNATHAKSTKNVKVSVNKLTPKLTAKKKTFKTTTKTINVHNNFKGQCW